MRDATNTVYLSTRKGQENIRKVLCRLRVKMLRERQLTHNGHLRQNSTNWIFTTIARLGVHDGVCSAVRGRLVLPADVTGRRWSVGRWRRASGHPLVEGFECHRAGGGEGSASLSPRSTIPLSPSPLRFCASTAWHLGIPHFNILAGSRNQMEP